MVQIAFTFNITPKSFFENKEIESDKLIIIVKGIKINPNTEKVLDDKKFQIISNSTKKNKDHNNSFTYYYGSETLRFKQIESFEQNVLNSFIILRPKIHLKDIISLQDSILFLKANKYIKIEQELDATNELFLDRTIPIRIQSILEILKII